MEGWSKLQTSFSGLNIGQSANKFAKGFSSSVQATKERLGQVSADEITELPQGVYGSSTVEEALLSRLACDRVQGLGGSC